MQMDKEKWEFLYIFMGKDNQIKEWVTCDMDLMQNALDSKVHYTEREHNEYDGPSRGGSYTNWITGKYYVIPMPVGKDKYTKFDAWDLKKLIPFLEKDWYKCDLKTSSGSYGSRSYDLTMIDKDWKSHRLARNSARKSFWTGYLPKKLLCDDFEVMGIWYNDKTKIQTQVQHTTQNTVSTNDVVSTDEIWNIEGKWYTISRNKEKNWIEITFSIKPPQTVIDSLKANSYRWSFANKCWYKKDRWESDEDIAKKIS
jgi:hypothetical protein